MKFILLLILISVSAHAGLPVDIVFDIDLTIATLIDHGDPLGGPAENVYKVGSERYRIFEGMTDLMLKLKNDPNVRVSFFSGGTEARNEELLRKVKMKDGSSLWELARGRVYGRTSMTPTGLGPGHRIRERFKKDLTKINPNLEDVILIDDIREFVPDSQRGNMFWIGEDFPFPDRHPVPNIPIAHPEIHAREKNKYQWISAQLERALAQRYQTGQPLTRIVGEITDGRTLTPFTSSWSVPGRACDVRALDRLLSK